MPAFTAADLEQLAAHGVTPSEAERQLALLRRGPRPVTLDRPCTQGDGVLVLSPAEQEEAAARGQVMVDSARVTRFVPASGAATRMFQELSVALEAEVPASTGGGRRFFEHLDAFPFAAELRRRSGVAGAPSDPASQRLLLRTLFETMGYRDLPKGLIPFHHGMPPRTAFEEQLREAARTAADRERRVSLHFTVVETARTLFERTLAESRARIERELGVSLDVSFSAQQASTDTIAVDDRGAPFRADAGRLLLRPSGHGALIGNLQAIDADVAVIKNIDNVLPDGRTAEVARWKLVLLGVLARIEAQAPVERPLRVCGVVRNQGEPGGAPFWVRRPDGPPTLQIVEAAQVAATPEQQRVFASATHFNPVDLVCLLRSASGKPFDLGAFVDPDASFLARKSYEGRPLVALERPGLWNGAMAHWDTVCVEVPASTFAPVKTVFDLLRPQHQ